MIGSCGSSAKQAGSGTLGLAARTEVADGGEEPADAQETRDLLAACCGRTDGGAAGRGSTAAAGELEAGAGTSEQDSLSVSDIGGAARERAEKGSCSE